MKKGIAILLVVFSVFALFAQGGKEPANQVSSSAEVVKGGTLDIAVKGNPSSMLSWRLRGPIDRAYGCIIWEKLFNFDESGNPVVMLLDSYEQNPDALTYTFHVKQGVYFHDGSELTAEVVKWNLDMYKAEGAQSASFLGNVDSVEVVDKYTCILHLGAWDALIPFYMAREGGCGYIQSQEAYEKNGKDWCAKNPVTTGPFKFVSWNSDVDVVLERNENYWQGEVLLDKVVYHIYQDDSTIQAAFIAGEVDAMLNATTTVAEVLKGMGFDTVVGGVPANCYTICFESKKEADPFHDIRVRQAASYAIDRDSIAKVLFGDYGTSTTQYAVKGSPYYNEEVDGYPYDIEKAKALMKESGYENGFDTVIYLNSSGNTSIQLGQIIVEELSAINIRAEIKLVDNAAYTKLIDGWDGGINIHGMGMDAGVPTQIAGSYRDGLSSGIGLNSFDRPAELGPTISAGLASDAEGVVQNFKKAQKIIFQDHCLLKAVAVNFPVAIVSPKVHDSGLGATVSTSADLWNAWIEK